MGKRKLSIDEVRLIFEENGCRLLEDNYINNKTKMEYICSCGNKSDISLNNFKKGNRCYNCGNKKRTEKLRLNQKEVINRVEKSGFKYLSHKIVNKRVTVKIECECGGISETTLGNIERTEGCMKCRYKKENNPNWKGGISTESNLIRTSNNYQTWRLEVFERDGYNCKCCGTHEGELRAHHIESFSENPDKRMSLDNGITLCLLCHDTKYEGSFHNIYGTVNFTKEQLEDYIKSKQLTLV